MFDDFSEFAASNSVVLALFLAGSNAKVDAEYKDTGAPSQDEPILLDTIMKEVPHEKGMDANNALDSFNDRVE